MDDSDTRRGMPAVHRRFATLHRGSGWTGDGERFGLAGAVLAGDLCLVWSDELFTAAAWTPRASPAAAPVFDRMRTELMGGQYLDMLEQAVAGRSRHPPDDDAAGRRGPRACHPLQERQVHDRAAAAHRRRARRGVRRLLAAYSAYGLPLGEAFQLRDDVLGVFGDPEQTGKPAGRRPARGQADRARRQGARDGDPGAGRTCVRSLLGDPGLDAARRRGAARGHRLHRRAGRRRDASSTSCVGQCRAALAAADVDPAGPRGPRRVSSPPRRRGSSDGRLTRRGLRGRPAGCPAGSAP